VRGSCPCPSDDNVRYGGNTASVLLRSDGDGAPLLLDLGTGVRRLPVAPDVPFRATALVTHLHFDHIQGLPFFPAVLDDAARLDIYAPAQAEGSVEAAFAGLIRPPYFPVPLASLAAELYFWEVSSDAFAVGAAKVTARPVPHVGPTAGYRIEQNGLSVTYISDHQAPVDAGSGAVADTVLELCDGVDLLIHDAQYTAEEFAAKPDWGHSTVDYAVRVATEAGARRLVLFHHDPAHDDATLDRFLEQAQSRSRANGGPEVLAAAEGLSLTVAR
jgi:ribonuclease BN (tRNA processing enzyme)